MRTDWSDLGRTRRRNVLLPVMLLVSVTLHGSALYAGHRWQDCLCRIGRVVCPKICYEPQPRIDLQLKPAPPPPPQPKPKPKPQVVAPVRPDKPPAAPKRGRVVLPEEALKPAVEPPKETTARLPSLPQEVVVKQSEAKAPVMATPGIFDRAGDLSAGPAGEFGLGGTGTGTGAGPFGTAKDGGGSGSDSGSSATAPPPPPPPPPKPEPEPEPKPKPKGPSRPPKVINWTDPPYPPQARQQGVEGTVSLRLTVGADGKPRDVRVSQSSGHTALDDAAVAHVGRARFSPALKNGEPVAVTITFKVKFRLVSS
jgi:TonB family protein